MRRLLLILCMLAVPWAGFAQDRVALVIGNAAYQSGALRNPVNDATDVASRLRSLGFTVLGANNLDREGMVRQMQAFRAALRPGGIGLFFYSGHGVEVNSRNFLLPVNNAAIRTVEDVEVYGLEAQSLVSQMQAAGTELNVVILDACRDNPLPSAVRSAGKGLARMDSQQGTVIAYATSERQVAADGAGRNSPYTSALLKYLSEPGLEVSQLFNRIGLEVSRTTRGAQVPWVSSSPVPPVMLAGVGVVQQPAASAAAPAKQEAAGTDTGAVELAFWKSTEALGTAEGYRTYLQRYPAGQFKDLAELKLKPAPAASTLNAPEEAALGFIDPEGTSWKPELCISPPSVDNSDIESIVLFDLADVLEAVPHVIGRLTRYRVDYRYKGENYSTPALSHLPGKRLRVQVVIRPSLTVPPDGRFADVLRVDPPSDRDTGGFYVEFRYRGNVFTSRLPCDPGVRLPILLSVNPVDT